MISGIQQLALVSQQATATTNCRKKKDCHFEINQLRFFHLHVMHDVINKLNFSGNSNVNSKCECGKKATADEKRSELLKQEAAVVFN